MSRPQLALVHNIEVVSTPVPFSQLLADHHAILQGYLDTHVTRNHSDRTIASEHRFLMGWFESLMVQDDDHPDGRIASRKNLTLRGENASWEILLSPSFV